MSFSSGCGFHLRGAEQTAPSSFPQELATLRVRQVNVQGDTLRLEMERALRTRARVNVVANDEVVPVLTLYDERSDRRAISVGSDVRVSEFLLRYRVAFDVKDASGKDIVSRQTISLQRTFTFDKNAVLAMEREAQEINARMREQAIQQIIIRLAVTQS
ncbi:MAG: LPS assembly lipoprotein LptE [Acidiferrobacterales bacterium]